MKASYYIEKLLPIYVFIFKKYIKIYYILIKRFSLLHSSFINRILKKISICGNINDIAIVLAEENYLMGKGTDSALLMSQGEHPR